MTYDPKRYPAQQDAAELKWLIDELVKRNATSFLEIGCRFGQTLWAVGQALPKGSLIVGVDKPADQTGRDALAHCIKTLNQMGHRAHIIDGDSRNNSVIQSAVSLGPQEGYDGIFIDADHKIESVVLDWINYGKRGKLIAFHDVGFVYDRNNLNYKPNKTPQQKRIDVPDLWRVLKDRYPHHTSECVMRPGKWGIGILVWQ